MEKNYGSDGFSVDSADKGKKNGLKIGIIVVVLALVVGGVAFAATSLFKSDKAIVSNAFMTSMTGGEETPFEKHFGFGDLYKGLYESAYEQGLSFRIGDSTDPTLQSLKGFEMTMSGNSDVKASKSSGTFGVKYSGLDLVDLNYFADSSRMMASVPSFTDKVFTVDYANDLEGQIKKSPLFGDLIDLEDETVKSYIDMLTNTEELNNKYKDLDIYKAFTDFKSTADATANLYNNMTVTKVDAKEFQISNKAQNCKGYNVVIPKDSVIELSEAYIDFMLNSEIMNELFWNVNNISMSAYEYDGVTGIDGFKKEYKDIFDEMIESLKTSVSDINVTMYITKDGDLASMSAESTTEELVVKYNVDYLGGNTMTENFKGSLALTIDGEEGIFDFEKKGSFENDKIATEFIMNFNVDNSPLLELTYNGEFNVNDGAYSVEFNMKPIDTYGGDSSIVFSSNGSITDVKKGKSFTLNADSILLKADGESFEFAGSLYIKPYSGEIKELEGTTMDALAASQEDWMEVYTEVGEKIQPLMEQIGSLLY